MNFHIRNEQPSDLDAITQVTEQAFLNAPHTSHTEHLVVNALRSRGKLTISLVAEEQGELVGHIAISPVTIQGDDNSGRPGSASTPNWYGLGPVSVRPDRQGDLLIRQTNSFLLFVCNDRACTGQALSPAARRRAGASMRLMINMPISLPY
ncbi:predicted acetyltransferase [Hahella chejuensis KCTC 2396]|uniref:Predicted acetyltransferase n=1 Tax=Hahella chejuensis (strain KCTC 2396) TaxID=349521 RepID=Q2SFU5_HAHCH|nr:N-acetyltransferase [Hahella chejuensis]ABC30479.1 predicted acetyltransferase [Hahella chejuensis KCTC 2396]